MFSFTRRKKIVDASPYIRRIIDITSPNRMLPGDLRSELRYNRSIPVVMCPWERKRPDLRQLTMGFTTDLSDSGIGVMHHEAPIESESVLLSFIMPPEDCEAWYFVADIEKREGKFGFHRLGLSMVEALKSHQSSVVKFGRVVEELTGVAYSPVGQ